MKLFIVILMTAISYALAATEIVLNANCGDTHTCPGGCTTCVSPVVDTKCCEPGYLFGLADINLCPDDSPVNIVWAGTHNIQESVSHDCESDEISKPLTFADTDVDGFLGPGTRKSIVANLLSGWNSTRYFRCSRHCHLARLRVTCNRTLYMVGYNDGYAAGQTNYASANCVDKNNPNALKAAYVQLGKC